MNEVTSLAWSKLKVNDQTLEMLYKLINITSVDELADLRKLNVTPGIGSVFATVDNHIGFFGFGE